MKWAKFFSKEGEYFIALLDAKLKQGLFVDPVICKLSKDSQFETEMDINKYAAWLSFTRAVSKLANNRILKFLAIQNLKDV